jgi:glycosyltransferase involved in cell wall biosynthesis
MSATDEPMVASDGHPRRRPRVAVLWAGLSGYQHASLQALVDEGADVLVFHKQPVSEAPYDATAVTSGLRSEAWTDAPAADVVGPEVEAFDPDAVLLCGWAFGGYRKVGRRLRGRTLRIMAMDNQWWGTLKQWGGVMVSPFVLRPAHDAALVADERQAVFAAKLGFPAERLIWGMYSCDHARFAAVAEARGDAVPPKAFLFAGRLVPDKAVDVLAAGYAAYRGAVDDPWPLLVAGTGPQADLLRGQPGVEMLGFVQPDDLPKVFDQAGCLVLPSRFEPWAVVIHEATAAGLPVVCTRVCGASTRLVLDGYNGVVVSPESPSALASGLGRIHRAGDDERRAMGEASALLARQYTPERWAQNLLRRIPDLRAAVGLDPAPWR